MSEPSMPWLHMDWLAAPSENKKLIGREWHRACTAMIFLPSLRIMIVDK